MDPFIEQQAKNLSPKNFGNLMPPNTGSTLNNFIIQSLLGLGGLGPRGFRANMGDFVTAQNKMRNVQLEQTVDGGTKKIGGWLEPRLSSKDIATRLPNSAANHKYIIDKIKQLRAVNE